MKKMTLLSFFSVKVYFSIKIDYDKIQNKENIRLFSDASYVPDPNRRLLIINGYADGKKGWNPTYA